MKQIVRDQEKQIGVVLPKALVRRLHLQAMRTEQSIRQIVTASLESTLPQHLEITEGGKHGRSARVVPDNDLVITESSSTSRRLLLFGPSQ